MLTSSLRVLGFASMTRGAATPAILDGRRRSAASPSRPTRVNDTAFSVRVHKVSAGSKLSRTELQAPAVPAQLAVRSTYKARPQRMSLSVLVSNRFSTRSKAPVQILASPENG
jgi:hypothetical protein